MRNYETMGGQDVALSEIVPDPALLAARTQARLALEEITEARSIGAEVGFEAHEERVVTLFFECNLAGYPGWRWAATLAKVDESAPVNVLEVELLPGAGAVVAPDWVPWSERLAQFRDAQAQQHAADEAFEAEEAASELSDEDEAEESVLDNDYSDYDADLHGVDVDDSDDDAEEDSDDDSDDDGEEDRVDEAAHATLFADSDDVDSDDEE